MGDWRFDGVAGRPSAWAVAALICSLAVVAAGLALLAALPVA